MFSKVQEFFGGSIREVKKTTFDGQTRPLPLYCNANLGLDVPGTTIYLYKKAIFRGRFAMAWFFPI